MKKQIPSKLSLSRETLRNLSRTRLSSMAGARPNDTGTACEPTHTANCAPTPTGFTASCYGSCAVC